MGLALKDDPGAFPRVLFQPKFFRLLAHLVLVPAQHVRRGRDSVAEGEGNLRSSRSILDQGSPEFASIASLLRLERRAGTKGSARMLPTPERQKSKTPGFAGEQMNL